MEASIISYIGIIGCILGYFGIMENGNYYNKLCRYVGVIGYILGYIGILENKWKLLFRF